MLDVALHRLSFFRIITDINFNPPMPIEQGNQYFQNQNLNKFFSSLVNMYAVCT
ncbi:hypothetical protein Sjap_000254 [Stephania japonica]|uniref:Uncharacterized protein n=1 Tax=Stephania japonica TaxID=461633 RepID=A0AAP0KJV5_9MAGN